MKFESDIAENIDIPNSRYDIVHRILTSDPGGRNYAAAVIESPSRV